MKRRTKKIVISAILLIGIVLMALASGCADRLFFWPNARVYADPAADGVAYEDVWFESADGTRLHGWFLPGQGEVRGTVVQFHGNGQNMTAHYAFVKWLPGAGFNVLQFDYRGYGESEGKPERRGAIADAKAAIRYVQGREDVDASKIIVLGQSLGGAISVHVVGCGELDGIIGLVVDSGFSDYQAVAGDHCGWFGFMSGWLISGDYRPLDVVEAISPQPVVFIHGTADRVVRYYHGERLFKKAGEPKALWSMEGGHHIDALVRPEIIERLKKELTKWTAEAGQDGAKDDNNQVVKEDS